MSIEGSLTRMLNNPILCQYFVRQSLEITHNQFPESDVYHGMDSILLSNSNIDTLERVFEEIKKIVPCWGLQIPPEKNTKRR